MFERFTKEARAVVVLAQGEAATRRDNRVGSEHLLIAALVAAPGLEEEIGLTADGLRWTLGRMDQAALESVGVMIDPGTVGASRWRKGHIPFTGSAKEVLVEALRQATSLGNRHIGVEHILLGLTHLPAQDRATRLMTEEGADPAEIRAKLASRLRRAS